MANYKRVLIKLSGEALAGEKGFGFHEETVLKVAEQVKKSLEAGIQISIVIGGGNFWRGRSNDKMDRTKADQIGMMATIMNALYVAEMFRGVGMEAIVQTPFAVGMMTELFSKDQALAHMKKGRVVFFAGGTGHPFFSTDTGAALRGCEIEADVLLFAKNIDGVYDDDPKTNINAKKYNSISCMELIAKGLKVMDLAAASLCMDQKLPILVFALNAPDSIYKAASGENIGTLVTI